MNTQSFTIREICSHLESIAPLAFQESYDNSGLIIGNAETKVTSVLITLDCTEEVIHEAIKRKCNFIIAHHPIIFKGLKRLNGKNYVERTVMQAIKHDIAIYAIHTNLDNVQNGVNKQIADRIGLIHTRILAPGAGVLKKLVTFVPVKFAEKVKDAMFAAGAGNIGNYDRCSFSLEGTGSFRANEGTDPFVGNLGKDHDEKEVRLEVILPGTLQSGVISALRSVHPYEEPAFDIYHLENILDSVGAGMIGELIKPLRKNDFLAHLKSVMNLKMIRYTEMTGKNIQKVAICGGSGAFLIKSALAAKADAFVTADVKYHDFFDSENRMMITDIGHFESEVFTKELIRDIILEKFPTFAVLLSKTNTNPINYF